MSRPLRVLILEDRPADTELNLAELRRTGFDPEWRRVETEADCLAALEDSPELVLADYSLPQFHGMSALKLLQRHRPDIPFILVSDMVGEATAVEVMKPGAADALLENEQFARTASEPKRRPRSKPFPPFPPISRCSTPLA